MQTESIEITLTDEQETTDIAVIGKASIGRLESNKKAYEDLRDKYTGIVTPEFKDPEFKKTHKLLIEGSGALVKARTAATKLVKQEVGKLKEVIKMVEGAGEDLIAITADTEKEIKAQKEIADTYIEDDKQEQLRLIEEKKQARMVELLNLGMTAKPGYYEISDITVSQMELIQSTEAQWEGKIAQVKVAYEAEQLRISEEKEAEEKKIADDKKAAEELTAKNKAAQELLEKANAENKIALDKQAAELREAMAERTMARIDKLKAKNFVFNEEANSYDYRDFVIGVDYIESVNREIFDSKVMQFDIFLTELNKPAETPLKVIKPLKFTAIEKEQIIDAVVIDDTIKEFKAFNVILQFTETDPYIDTIIGKATLRIYTETFLDEANEGLLPEQVSASGSISDDLLFMVIKGK